MRRIVLSFALIQYSISGGAAPLADVVSETLKSHPDIESSQALLEASEERVKQARSAFLPSLGLTYENAQQTEDVSNATIDRDISRFDGSLTWNLYRGAADSSALKSARASKEASKDELSATREQLALGVIEVYLDVVKNQQLLEISQTLISDLQSLTDKLTRRAQIGRVSKVAVHQAQTRLVQATNRHFQLRAALSGAKLRFREITGQAPEELSEPVFADIVSGERSIDALYTEAVASNPRLVAARESAKSRKADIGVVGGSLLPSVDLELRKRIFSDVSPDSTTDTDSSLRVLVNYEMPLGGASFSRKAEAVDRKRAAEAKVASLERQIRAELGAQYRQLIEERNIAPNLVANVEAAKSVVAGYHRQFEAGRRTLLDLLTAYSDLYQARSSVVENRFAQLLSNARIHYQMGQLLAAISSEVSSVRN